MSDPRVDTIRRVLSGNLGDHAAYVDALDYLGALESERDDAQRIAANALNENGRLRVKQAALVADLEAAETERDRYGQLYGAEINAREKAEDERNGAVERARKAAERASVILRDASVRLRTATGEGYTFEQGRIEVARELADALAEETQ